MQRLISVLCACILAGVSSMALAGTSSADGANGPSAREGSATTTDTVKGDAGVVSPSDTNRGVGTVGNDQETRAGQNTQEGVNSGTRTVPPNSNRAR